MNTPLLHQALPALLGSALCTLIGCAGFAPAPEPTAEQSLAAQASPALSLEQARHETARAEQRAQVSLKVGPEAALTPKDVNLFAASCNTVSALPCAPGSCEQELQARWTQASAFGCGSEFLALWTCVANEGATCESGLLVPAPDCTNEAKELKQCQPQCVSSMVQGQCSYNCAGGHPFGAGCEQQGSELHCKCDSGQHAGLVFTLQGECDSPINGKPLMQILAQKCQ